MKKVAIVVIMLMMTTGVAWGSEAKTLREMNGADWKAKSPLEKANWIEGFVTSTYVVLNNYVKYLPSGDLEEKVRWIKIVSSQKESAQERLAIYGTTLIQLQKAMDKLYEDYRNEKIAIVDAIYIARMELSGSKPELIEAQKRYLRMQPTPGINELAIDWTNAKAAQEEKLRAGGFADPNKENPTKEEDYSFTSLFRYGTYK